MNTEDLNNVENETKKLPVANILVAGITGVGKSTLVNAVFGRNLAETGQGKAITDHMSEYYNDKCPIRIWDTVGLEIDSSKSEQSIRDIRRKIEEKALKKDEKECIHAIWFCINSGSNRYQEGEIRFIEKLHALEVPFIIVLTQCIGDLESTNNFERFIRDENKKRDMADIEVVQVLAEDKKLSLPNGQSITIEKFGLDTLVERTQQKLPDYLETSFIAAQNVCRENKRSECEDIILKYVRKSLDGVWDNIWLINIPATNSNIKSLLIEISHMYEQILTKEDLSKEMVDADLKFEHIWNGLIIPWQGKYGKRVQDMFEKKVGGGYEGKFIDLPKSHKAARLIAFYGFIFIDSVEEVWDMYNNKKIDDIAAYVRDLIKRINDHLDEGKKSHKI